MTLQTNLPCSHCGSSDARAVYESGWSHCFSCGRNTKVSDDGTSEAPRKPRRVGLVGGIEYEPLKSRKISEETCRTT